MTSRVIGTLGETNGSRSSWRWSHMLMRVSYWLNRLCLHSIVVDDGLCLYLEIVHQYISWNDPYYCEFRPVTINHQHVQSTNKIDTNQPPRGCGWAVEERQEPTASAVARFVAQHVPDMTGDGRPLSLPCAYGTDLLAKGCVAGLSGESRWVSVPSDMFPINSRMSRGCFLFSVTNVQRCIRSRCLCRFRLWGGAAMRSSNFGGTSDSWWPPHFTAHTPNASHFEYVLKPSYWSVPSEWADMIALW